MGAPRDVADGGERTRSAGDGDAGNAILVASGDVPTVGAAPVAQVKKVRRRASPISRWPTLLMLIRRGAMHWAGCLPNLGFRSRLRFRGEGRARSHSAGDGQDGPVRSLPVSCVSHCRGRAARHRSLAEQLGVHGLARSLLGACLGG